MKNCCSKCGINYPRIKEYFSLDKRREDGLSSWCRGCHRKATINWRKGNWEKIKEYQKKYRQENKEKRKDFQKSYSKTFEGRVVQLINAIKRRCTDSNHVGYKYWGGKGVKCCFNHAELLSWLIINEIDPRGLEIHRINNNGNYTLDNIEFLTKKEHRQLHKKGKQNERRK